MSKADASVHAHGGPGSACATRTSIRARPRPGRGADPRTRRSASTSSTSTIAAASIRAPTGLPLIPGSEAAGVVARDGRGGRLARSRAIASPMPTPLGAYARSGVIAADRLVKIPDGVSDEQAAAMMLKGMTAEYLLRRTFAVKPGDTCSIMPPPAASG